MASKSIEHDKAEALVKRLKEHPELMERFEAILAITENEGEIMTADEAEGQVIDEVRRLGKATLEDWACEIEKRVSEEVQAKNPHVYCTKKNG